MVCTALHNVATPLIRYELGDLAEVGDACSCGRGLPVLRRIIGRVRNLVTLPTGEQRHPVFSEDLMLAIAPIRQYQLIQRSLTEIDVFLVTERPLGSDEQRALASYFSRQFGYRFAYRWHRAAHLPASVSGKYEVFRSEVAA